MSSRAFVADAFEAGDLAVKVAESFPVTERPLR
jgi:hypothetical protein